MSKGKNTVKLVAEAVAPYVEQLGLRLWDVRYVKEGPSWFLRIIIDRQGGVTIQDCEDLSRAIDPLIDELDPCEHEYFLEVSSPGLGRSLRTDAHLTEYIGRPVILKFYRPDEDRQKTADGTLTQFSADELSLKTQTGERTIARRLISEIKADDDRDITQGEGHERGIL